MASDPIGILPEFLERRRQSLPDDLAWDAGQDYARWACDLRRRWLADLPPCADPAEAVIDGENITMIFATGAATTGRFVLPDGPGPHPAVILYHDHGAQFDIGWQKLADDPMSQDSRERLYDGIALIAACQAAGFAVLCVDALGWGARKVGGYAGQQALAANAMGLGWSLAGIVAAEDVQAARWLSTHQMIDAARIGSLGFSFGGFRAWQVAALCDRIAAAACVGWMACRTDLMRPGAPLLQGQSAFYMLHLTLSGRVDFPDMAGLAVDRPLFLRSGHGDRHMPVESAQRAFDRLAMLAQAAGGPGVDAGFHDAGHTCPAHVTKAALEFLTHRLQ